MGGERIIEAGGKKLAIHIPHQAWEKGLNFYSDDGDYIQAGTWGFDKGARLGPHLHNHVPREAARTQEVLFVKSGRIAAHFFDDQGTPLTTVELGSGDVLVVLDGGHGYEVLENETFALEVKNGPYPGAEVDRRKLAWPD